MPWAELHHADADALARACAERIGQAIDAALSERGRALLALAGGSTSPPILRRLAAQQRDWRAVTVVPTDERWVPAEHPDSNLRSMRAALTAADGIRWCALAPAATAGPPDAAFANAALAAHPGPFDLGLLGMGTDGHFASLLPGAPNLAAALDPAGADAAVAVVPDPLPAAAPHARISLTLAPLLRSRRLLLAITGSAKLDVLHRAQQPAGAAALPVTALLRAPHPAAEIHWSP